MSEQLSLEEQNPEISDAEDEGTVEDGPAPVLEEMERFLKLGQKYTDLLARYSLLHADADDGRHKVAGEMFKARKEMRAILDDVTERAGEIA
ncbi:hypothetical protein [Salipiger mucosus]|uniref:Uncharacterized protein n=1 Tax=Salipiger mucosus DSM 16094 TaxID=1123237 RepID=S9QV63_9RHOB|nr:hypothetical protein [Salipiger mucosus]EPX83462.1 hypothetical protein Salmuc_02070 [Salipiger mucosus DSM 16094]